MLHRAARLGAVLLCLFLLCACGENANTVTCDDLTLTLPKSYVNLSNEIYAEEFDFLYGIGSEAVLGFKYSRASLEQKFPGISAKEYAEKFIEAAQLACEVSEKDGLVTFSYTQTSDSAQITYLSAVFMTQDNVWIVQFYCPASEYAQKSTEFYKYLQAVQS